ncbi:DUF4105 domain-containing protein [Marinobacter daepoensis]|uniref:DUF4105 domain-containing protein n=1 Tax=Marinobacter daepoensis TaxID=262077 RepID=A0ABS3BGF9_9GAMM|nr:DUF4105 domain-containing protein [Marinobacter daepoensis]MBN7770681.1 DUF4105 domain-containing protein [Marinobacter daepoensis]MBY6034037.1 DUF4105 domain-containing protein [Marinobacter daepoensis]MBY6078542.1 DUF4105 domain-containing protein [Marinobacter daepoensis]
MGFTLRSGQAILWLACSTTAWAQTEVLTLPENLHQHPTWLTLGHYHQDTLGESYTSQADDPGFFLSQSGKTSPKAELDATLKAIQQPGGGDEHARCRFPARDAWLREQLDLPDTPVNCPAFEEWSGTLNTENVTLVFAASYLNSPSSMFGHTFLRLDPPQDDDEADLLLANTISYAADAAEHDNELLFAYRGIFGGYPGITSIKPYYEMIRLYNDIEHRDLWEYTLNLDQQEVDTLIAHTWEIQDKNFDYYFFDENCAYRLLALIDAARPGTSLLDEVSTHAIPSDTVRWVRDAGLVESVNYRPSAATSVAHSLDSLPAEHQTIAAAMANGYLTVDASEVRNLSNNEQAQLFDATYDYVRYQSEAEAWPREHAAPLSHQLLVARSQIDNAEALPDVPEPQVRDDQGHDTFRVSLGTGQLAGSEFTQLTLRPAYHDVLDPPEGYRGGAQLQFLRLDARLYHSNNELQVERITGVEIRSLSPRNPFFAPISWQVGFGGRRTDTGTDRVLTPYLEGGAGGSWRLGDNTQAFAIATADLEIDDDLRRGYDAAPGADLGLLHQNNRFSLLAGAKTKAWIVSSQHRQDQLYLEGNWHIGREFSLFTKFSREDHFDRYQSTWQAGLHAYF